MAVKESAKKAQTNLDFNNSIYSEIKNLEIQISVLKDKLKPVEPIKNATLAECNALARNKG